MTRRGSRARKGRKKVKGPQFWELNKKKAPPLCNDCGVPLNHPSPIHCTNIIHQEYAISLAVDPYIELHTEPGPKPFQSMHIPQMTKEETK